jgi:hypothetical protein
VVCVTCVYIYVWVYVHILQLVLPYLIRNKKNYMHHTTKRACCSIFCTPSRPNKRQKLRAFPRVFYFFSQKHVVLQLLKRYWEEKRSPSPRVFNNSFLKYRRQFYIKNPILFLNYNHFYIFFLSHTFALGTLSYFLFFLIPSTFRLTD